MRRAVIFAVSLGFLALTAPNAAAVDGAPAFTTERYLADFEQIKRELAERAPNLDWAVAERGVDLKQRR